MPGWHWINIYPCSLSCCKPPPLYELTETSLNVRWFLEDQGQYYVFSPPPSAPFSESVTFRSPCLRMKNALHITNSSLIFNLVKGNLGCQTGLGSFKGGYEERVVLWRGRCSAGRPRPFGKWGGDIDWRRRCCVTLSISPHELNSAFGFSGFRLIFFYIEGDVKTMTW